MAETRSTCPICSSPSLRRKPFKYVFHASELRGWSCDRCGIIFLHPQPTAEELKQLYSAEYFEGGDFRCGHEEGYSDPATLEKMADPGLLIVIKGMTTGRRFLEIGCAGGAFLNTARELGFEVQGVELSEDACRIAQETFGLQVFAGELVNARFPDRSFDVVFMGDVIEHLPDPIATLREVKRLLDSKGMLVMGLPSQTNNLFSRIGFFVFGMLGKSATVALPPYHLFEYRPRSLRFLLELCGFHISRLDQGIIPPSQISLRGPAVQRWGKLVLQYPNFILTRVLKVCGDRLTVFASAED
jgi:SAM-dependent methyltransferase